VAEAHFEAGYVPPEQDVDEFARALRAVGEPIFGMDATRISMGRLLHHLFEVTERFGMRTRTELIHLQRTMVVVEGVARSLDPRMNIWEAARPEVEGYVARALGPVAVAQDLLRTARVLARFGPLLPQMAEALLIRRGAAAEAPRRWREAALWGGAGVAVALLGLLVAGLL
jgi:ubiquinone biosynthesis protein